MTRWQGGWLIGLAAMAPLACGAVRAQDAASEQAPLRVTTDSQEYCEKLSRRVTELEEARAHVSVLAEQLTREGRELCAGGRVRAGIARLRRAVVLLRYTSQPNGN